jgi:hypothetical protein
MFSTCVSTTDTSTTNARDPAALFSSFARVRAHMAESGAKPHILFPNSYYMISTGDHHQTCTLSATL